MRRAKASETFHGHRLVLAAVRELRETLELLARMAGELAGEGATVNILLNPQWVSLQATILRPLDPYPQAP